MTLFGSYLKYILLLVSALFLAACSPAVRLFTDKPVGELDLEDKPALQVDFKLLYIKSPIISYYDYALTRTNRDGTITVELFKLGKNFGNITIGSDVICFLNECAPKWPTSKKFFGKVAYAKLFDDIILKRDIFDGKGKIIGRDHSIIQRFTQSGQVIFYQRTKTGVLYRNLSNGVTLSLEQYIDPSKPKDPDDTSTVQNGSDLLPQ